MTTADGYIGQAQALIAVGRQADAVPLLQRTIAAEPESPYPRYVLAACFIDLARHDDACKMAESAIAVSPEFSPAHQMHSLALLGLGKRKAALDAAAEAVRLSPSDADAMMALGEAQLANRQFDDAVRSADRVLALDSASFEGHYLLGRIALGRKRWKEAEAHCREALRIDPRSWVAMNNLGVALQGRGRHKEAVAAFENAAKLNPKDELVRRNLFSQSQIYIGAGVLTILIAQGIRVGILAHGKPLPLIVGLLILLLGAGVVAVIRKRQLSPTVQQFYSLERRRRWAFSILYVPILVAGLIGFVLTEGSWASVIVLVAAVGLWWYVGPHLWQNTILPRVLSKKRESGGGL